MDDQKCPIDCPGRTVQRAKGKIGSYGFAIVLGLMMVSASYERGEDGWVRFKENPPYPLYSILMPAIGLCLGIQIDAEAIGRILGK